MIYNLSDRIQARKANSRLQYLIDKGAKIDLTEKKHKRTLSQNSYFYLIIEYYGSQIGFTKDESKQFFKRFNQDIFFYEKSGESFIRSSADLDKSEMQIALDRFINYSETNGIPLPRVEDMEFIDHARNEIETNKYYM